MIIIIKVSVLIYQIKFERMPNKPHRQHLTILTGNLCPLCKLYLNSSFLGPSTEQLWALEAG